MLMDFFITCFISLECKNLSRFFASIIFFKVSCVHFNKVFSYHVSSFCLEINKCLWEIFKFEYPVPTKGCINSIKFIISGLSTGAESECMTHDQ